MLVKSKPRRSRGGIILLVVLGMLTLFSVLGVSYLVFTSRQRSAAESIVKSETLRVDTKKLVQESLVKVLVGSNGPDSALWSHDLLGDLYGARDGVEANVLPVAQYPSGSIDCAPAFLMGNQFLRFPTELHVVAQLPYRRNDAQVERRYPGYPGTFNVTPPATRFPLDDMLNGRILTFREGPLEGLSFPIARSFGDHRNVPTTMPGRETLSGQVVIDIRSHLNTNVEIDGESRTLQEWFESNAALTAHRLIYDGQVGVNPVPSPYGEFYVNGRILNGHGLGWDRARTAFNMVDAGDPNFNLHEDVSTSLNVTVLKDRPAAFTPTAVDLPFLGAPYESGGTDLPVAFQGYYGLHRLPEDFSVNNQIQSFVIGLPPGDVDEPYDAPDHNNLWLSHFPDSPEAVAGLRELGEPTPSFVRPALVNWILNQQSSGDLTTLSPDRLKSILVALQRSTLRPLPFINDSFVSNVAIPQRSEGVVATGIRELHRRQYE